jgi:hypothetical protein
VAGEYIVLRLQKFNPDTASSRPVAPAAQGTARAVPAAKTTATRHVLLLFPSVYLSFVCAHPRHHPNHLQNHMRATIRNDKSPRLCRGVVLTAAAEPGVATGKSAQKSRVESFTVRFEHTLALGLHCGFTPTFFVQSASRPCRYAHMLSLKRSSLPRRWRRRKHSRTDYSRDKRSQLCMRARRVEKILKWWDKDGQEVKFDPSSDSKAVIQVDKGMTTLLLVKPLVRCSPPLMSMNPPSLAKRAVTSLIRRRQTMRATGRHLCGAIRALSRPGHGAHR